MKKFTIVEEVPDWEDCESLSVRRLECVIPPVANLKEIKSAIDAIDHTFHKETIKKAENPFSEVSIIRLRHYEKEP
jgi:hypothetical protein